ncbi:MAG: hypothetical protein RJQ09_09115 [Cyclobacteriaceae bacterium]
MDKLEKYIEDNHKDFDIENPSDKVWKNISHELNENDTTPTSFGWIWKAAAVLLFISTFYLLTDKYFFNQKQLATADPEMQEFLEAEEFFTRQINEKKSLLASYKSEEVTTEFLSDLANLDSMYLSLKKEMKATGTNDRVLDALIQNLQIKMEILNQQLMILERLKTQKNENDLQI